MKTARAWGHNVYRCGKITGLRKRASSTKPEPFDQLQAGDPVRVRIVRETDWRRVVKALKMAKECMEPCSDCEDLFKCTNECPDYKIKKALADLGV